MFRDDIALEDWRRAGADVRGERVHLDRAQIESLIATIPSEITLHARDPEKSVALGGRQSIFVPMTGAPYLRDLEDVRRAPTLDDLATFHKLSHMLPAMHSSAHHIVEPMDHPISHRHLRITHSSMLHSDKTFMGMTTSGRNAEDVLDMCAILFGEAFMETHSVVVGNCNGNSPLVWDDDAVGNAGLQPAQPAGSVLALRSWRCEYAGLDRTDGGAAECRGAVGAGYQLVRRDARPYGHYLSTVSMQSGAPMAGTPEISLMNFMIGQMARHYGVADSNTLGGAKTLDAQSGYESATTLMAVLMSGANYIWHSAGWNEAGMHCRWPNSSSMPNSAPWATAWPKV